MYSANHNNNYLTQNTKIPLKQDRVQLKNNKGDKNSHVKVCYLI